MGFEVLVASSMAPSFLLYSLVFYYSAGSFEIVAAETVTRTLT